MCWVTSERQRQKLESHEGERERERECFYYDIVGVNFFKTWCWKMSFLKSRNRCKPKKCIFKPTSFWWTFFKLEVAKSDIKNNCYSVAECKIGLFYNKLCWISSISVSKNAQNFHGWHKRASFHNVFSNSIFFKLTRVTVFTNAIYHLQPFLDIDFDWCCFFYFIINSLVALLEALFTW